MVILNLGCGKKIASDPRVTNIDWSMYLKIKNNKLLYFLSTILLDKDRKATLKDIPSNVMAYNLKKGIPFKTNSVDVVYHSHVLEHLDREVALYFLKECGRVLRHGGILRVVVPDFEFLVNKYSVSLNLTKRDLLSAIQHEQSISSIIEQCVRRESYGSKIKPPLRRKIENFILGDARSRGETHQWMYDEFTLSLLCGEAGFEETYRENFNTSRIKTWNELELDIDDQNEEYMPGSLYIEAIKG